MIKRILSVQSHVVHGHVGNKSATLPLQLLGFEVDALNTVQFSNHSGYPKVTGEKLNAETLLEIIAGLDLNGMLGLYTHILTGYVGSIETLESLSEMIKMTKSKNASVCVLVDTVMGDNGRMYVPSSFLGCYKKLLGLADIITPNGFEACLLADMEIKSDSDLSKAFEKLHALGPSIVIITSIAVDRTLILAGSCEGAQFRFPIDEIRAPFHFTGTGTFRIIIGDLFAALLIGYAGNNLTFGNIQRACAKAIHTLRIVLEKTLLLNRTELAIVPCIREIQASGPEFRMDDIAAIPGDPPAPEILSKLD